MEGAVHFFKPLLEDKERGLVEILMGYKIIENYKRSCWQKWRLKKSCVFGIKKLCVDAGFVGKENEQPLNTPVNEKYQQILQMEDKIISFTPRSLERLLETENRKEVEVVTIVNVVESQHECFVSEIKYQVCWSIWRSGSSIMWTRERTIHRRGWCRWCNDDVLSLVHGKNVRDIK